MSIRWGLTAPPPTLRPDACPLARWTRSCSWSWTIMFMVGHDHASEIVPSKTGLPISIGRVSISSVLAPPSCSFWLRIISPAQSGNKLCVCVCHVWGIDGCGAVISAVSSYLGVHGAFGFAKFLSTVLHSDTKLFYRHHDNHRKPVQPPLPQVRRAKSDQGRRM